MPSSGLTWNAVCCDILKYYRMATRAANETRVRRENCQVVVLVKHLVHDNSGCRNQQQELNGNYRNSRKGIDSVGAYRSIYHTRYQVLYDTKQSDTVSNAGHLGWRKSMLSESCYTVFVPSPSIAFVFLFQASPFRRSGKESHSRRFSTPPSPLWRLSSLLSWEGFGILFARRRVEACIHTMGTTMGGRRTPQHTMLILISKQTVSLV